MPRAQRPIRIMLGHAEWHQPTNQRIDLKADAMVTREWHLFFVAKPNKNGGCGWNELIFKCKTGESAPQKTSAKAPKTRNSRVFSTSSENLFHRVYSLLDSIGVALVLSLSDPTTYNPTDSPLAANIHLKWWFAAPCWGYCGLCLHCPPPWLSKIERPFKHSVKYHFLSWRLGTHYQEYSANKHTDNHCYSHQNIHELCTGGYNQQFSDRPSSATISNSIKRLTKRVDSQQF